MTDFLLACWKDCPTFNGDIKSVSDGFVVFLQLVACGPLREGYIKCVGDGFDVWLSFANYAFHFFLTLPDNQHQKYLTFVKHKDKRRSLTPTKYNQGMKGVSQKSLN